MQMWKAELVPSKILIHGYHFRVFFRDKNFFQLRIPSIYQTDSVSFINPFAFLNTDDTCRGGFYKNCYEWTNIKEKQTLLLVCLKHIVKSGRRIACPTLSFDRLLFQLVIGCNNFDEQLCSQFIMSGKWKEKFVLIQKKVGNTTFFLKVKIEILGKWFELISPSFNIKESIVQFHQDILKQNKEWHSNKNCS